ncbi:MAG: YbjQ family protein [Spirochaetales bacterium]|nr:YbjQ family protein [Spirochaetales bacterium]
MIIVTTDDIPGKKIVKTLGLVRGNTIRAQHIGKDIVAVFKNLLGGEIHDYTKMMAQSREQALDRLIEDAQNLGANGITGVRFATTSMMQSAAELLVYGTAVLCEDE